MIHPLRPLFLATSLGLCVHGGMAQESVAEKARALVRGELLAKASKLVSKGEAAVARGEYVRAEKSFQAAEALLAKAGEAPGRAHPKGRVVRLDDVTNGEKKRVVVFLEDVTHGEQTPKSKPASKPASKPTEKKKGVWWVAGAHAGAKPGPKLVEADAGGQVREWMEKDAGRGATQGDDREALNRRVTRLELEIEALGKAVRAFQRGIDPGAGREVEQRIQIRDALGRPRELLFTPASKSDDGKKMPTRKKRSRRII